MGLWIVGLCGCTPAAPPEPAAPPSPPIQVEPSPSSVDLPGADADPKPAPSAAPSELRTTDTGLGIVELRLGSGEMAKPGRQVSVHYVGMLDDGRIFDASRDRGAPIRFELGAGMVIAGWDEGIAGMRVGGMRRLIIPAHLGYGERGRAPIPPNAILEFEVELMAVE